MRTKLFLTVAAILFTGTAAAYVGPGAGISVLGALWGLIIGVVMAVSWWEFFTAFHRIFFKEGTWVFLRSDTLIRLFPMAFWIDVAVVAVVLLVFEAVVVAVMGWLWRRRIKAGV